MLSFDEENEKLNNSEEIEVVMGDDSELIISGVGDCMTDLRPKTEKKKNVVIPIAKSKKEDNKENKNN
jgi:hypothetical protein